MTESEQPEPAEGHGHGLDSSVQRAWTGFAGRLSSDLAAMGHDDVLTLSMEMLGEDGPGAVDVLLTRESNGLEAEVRHRLHADVDAAMLAASAAEHGWRLGEPVAEAEETREIDLLAEAPLDAAERLTGQVVWFLREVCGVLDPSFLSVIRPDEAPEATSVEEPVAVLPESAEHLRDLVDRAVTSILGHRPVHDDDGDIPIQAGIALVFIRVSDSDPVVEIFSVLAVGVDPERAAVEVQILNRDARFVRYSLSGDRVLVEMQLPARPFVPQHLRDMLGVMVRAINGETADLLMRIGGHRPFQPSDDE